MKRLFLTLFCFILCCSTFASIKIKEGNKSFMKQGGIASIIFDWSEALWDNWAPLEHEWRDEYNIYVKRGEESFIRGYNNAKKKVRIVRGSDSTDYAILVSLHNFDRYWFGRCRHKVWATISVKEVATSSIICVYEVEEFEGGRDFLKEDSYVKMMFEFGEEIAER